MTYGKGRAFEVVRRSASSVEQIEADVIACHVNARFDIAPADRRARTRTQVGLILDGMQIHRVHFAGGVTSCIRDPSHWLTFMKQGASRVCVGNSEAIAAPGTLVSTAHDGERMQVETPAGGVATFLTLAPSLLLRSGKALIGDKFELDHRTHTEAVRDHDAARALERNVNAIFLELAELERFGLGQLAMRSFTEIIGNLSVAALFPQRLDEASAAPAEPKLIQRAEEIMRGCAHEDLSVHDVAERLGVTSRTLQMAFRKHHGCSPLQFLIKCRLMLARDRLLEANARANVQSVAMGCGFMSMSTFSTRYRAMFGESPAATLARRRV